MAHELETQNKRAVLIRPPAYPHSSQQLLRSLQRQLEQALGRRLSGTQLAARAGLSRSTVHRWLGIEAVPQLPAFLCCLERLNPEQRHKFMQAHCWPLPALDQPPFELMLHRLHRLRALGLGASG